MRRKRPDKVYDGLPSSTFMIIDDPNTDPRLSALAAYYQSRASEYDAIYNKPEQQKDFSSLRVWLAEKTRNQSVLEVACGTGYWTSVAASTARHIIATEVNKAPMEFARAKINTKKVELVQANAFALPSFGIHLNCGMAHFWLSHVPKFKLPEFVQHLASKLTRPAKLLFIDSKYVEGYRKIPIRRDDEGNSFDLRTLKDGSQYEIVKNFLSRAEVLELLRPLSADIEYNDLNYLWSVSAALK